LLIFLSGCSALLRHHSFTQSSATKLSVGLTTVEAVSKFGNPDKTSLTTCGQWQCLKYRYIKEKLRSILYFKLKF
tara:strand:- start:238 stop:462 length:225 start_codon:yes stop_codon:yes gene_type:complete